MNSLDRKKIAVITSYVQESFSESDWHALGQLTGQLTLISNHRRLFKALSFGDDDYAFCAAEVLDTVFNANEAAIGEVIDHFDIDLWYQQKSPEISTTVFNSNLNYCGFLEKRFF